MAEVGVVYELTPLPRTPADIIGRDPEAERPVAPKARNKWLTASVLDDAATVIGSVFDEAQRRDPSHQRTWVALVDGAKHQIERIHAEAEARKINVTTVCDFTTYSSTSGPRPARSSPKPTQPPRSGSAASPRGPERARPDRRRRDPAQR